MRTRRWREAPPAAGVESRAPRPSSRHAPANANHPFAELRIEAILQMGRFLPHAGGLCCSVQEAHALLLSDGVALPPERRRLWRNLVDDINTVQCGGQAYFRHCESVPLYRDLRHKAFLALKDATPIEIMRFMVLNNKSSLCAAAAVLPPQPGAA